MAVEQFTNNLQTTINQGGGIAAGDVSAVIASATGWPTTGQWHVLIDSEIIEVTAAAGTTWTISRGREGTTAAAHANGAVITAILSGESLKGLGSVLARTDTYANQPAAAIEGRLFVPTDGIALYRDDGAAWSGYGPHAKLTTPDDTAFAWLNQGSSTVATGGGTTFLSVPSSGVFAARGRVKTIPAAPYTVTARLEFIFAALQYHEGGLVLRNSVSDKLITFEHIFQTGSLLLRVVQWTDSSTPTTAVLSTAVNHFYPWLRIQDDNTNRLYSISRDGINWVQWFSEVRTTFMTPNQIGYFIMNEGSGVQAGLTVQSWLEA